MNDKTIKVIFFGDLVGKPGRFAARDFLEINKNNYDFIIANVENASHGFGLTEKNYNDLSEYGIDCMTSGNHIWDKKEIFNYIENAEKLIRPYNYPVQTPGVGSRIFETANGIKIGVINVLGRVFMSPVESQWECVTDEIKRIEEITPIIFIDFHAEATAEKICFAKYCSKLNVSAFFGTHTHVQTADATFLPNGTAYITDVGMTGGKNSVIGIKKEIAIERFRTGLHTRFVQEKEDIEMDAAVIDTDKKTIYAIKR